jgi:hypothetical protein
MHQQNKARRRVVITSCAFLRPDNIGVVMIENQVQDTALLALVCGWCRVPDKNAMWSLVALFILAATVIGQRLRR